MSERFQAFEWLCVVYQDLARASDFSSLSGFERWMRLREQVRHSNMPGRLESLDRLELPFQAALLQWLDSGCGVVAGAHRVRTMG